MLKVVICVSIPRNRIILEQLIKECFSNNGISYSLVTFNNGSRLIEYLKKDHEVDVLFIENELNDVDGKEVVYQIRYELNKNEIKIILISKKQKDLLKLFKLQLYDFFILPLKKSSINEVIIEINNKLIDNNDYFYYRSQGALIKSDLDSILYFKSENRKITLYQQNNVIEFYDSLKDVMNRVDGKSFLKVHQSYLINMNHAQKIQENTILLDDGSVIPIGKSHKEQVIKDRCTIEL